MSSDEPPSPILTGSRLRALAAGDRFAGRFRLIAQLGQGGMGVVWQAHDETLELDVALKFLHEVLAHDEEALHDLKRETRRALQLTHPHIVRVHSLVEDAERGLTGIAMEYVPGENLTRRRLRQPNRYFSPDQIAPWLAQLCEALTYAHEKAAIIHRDLKPANILLDARDEVRITDFGISATASDSITRLTRASDNSGTLAYMSPQQAEGLKPTASDDLYALGSTLYELLTGKPPFYMGSILAQLVARVPPPVAQRREEIHGTAVPIPAMWEETLAAMLAKDSAARPPSAREVAMRLGLASPSTGTRSHFPAVAPTEIPVDLPTARGESEPLPPPLPTTHGNRMVPSTAIAQPFPPTLRQPGAATPRPGIPPALLWVGAALVVSIVGVTLGIALVKFTDKPDSDERKNSSHVESADPQQQAPIAQTAPPTKAPANTVKPAGEWHVPQDKPTIGAALAAAEAGDTVVVQPGTYSELLSFRSGVRIRGTDAALCRIVLAPGASCAAIGAGVQNVVVENLAIEAEPNEVSSIFQAGWNLDDRSGAVVVSGTDPSGPAGRAGLQSADTILAIDGVAVSTVEAVSALVSRNLGAKPVSLKVTNGGVERTVEVAPRLSAAAGGLRNGLVFVGSTFELRGCTVRGFSGTGVMIDGKTATAKIDNCTITGNSSRGIRARFSPLQMNNTRCIGNSGGGMSAESISNGFLMTGCTFSGSEDGGGLVLRNVVGIVRNCLVDENQKVGISVIDPGSEVTIESGRIRKNESHGIHFTQQARGTLTGNQLERNKGAGVAVTAVGTVVSMPSGSNQFLSNGRNQPFLTQGGLIKD